MLLFLLDCAEDTPYFHAWCALGTPNMYRHFIPCTSNFHSLSSPVQASSTNHSAALLQTNMVKIGSKGVSRNASLRPYSRSSITYPLTTPICGAAQPSWLLPLLSVPSIFRASKPGISPVTARPPVKQHFSCCCRILYHIVDRASITERTGAQLPHMQGICSRTLRGRVRLQRSLRELLS